MRRKKPELPFLSGLDADELIESARQQAYIRYGIESRQEYWARMIKDLARVPADEPFSVQDAEDWLSTSHDELVKTCIYCGETCLGKPYGPNLTGATWDHIIPKAEGGTDRQSNLVRACRFCNSSKGPLMIEAWVELMASMQYKDVRERKRKKIVQRGRSGTFIGMTEHAMTGTKQWGT